jgi:hypothetical protein
MPELPVFGPPYRIVWLDDAKVDVRRLDQPAEKTDQNHRRTLIAFTAEH